MMNMSSLVVMCVCALVARWICRREGHAWGRIEIQGRVMFLRNVPGCTRCGLINHSEISDLILAPLHAIGKL